MIAMASQITGISTVCSTVCSGESQRKHQSSATLAFVGGIHRWTGGFPSQRASNAENVSNLVILTHAIGNVTHSGQAAIAGAITLYPAICSSLCSSFGGQALDSIFTFWPDFWLRYDWHYGQLDCFSRAYVGSQQVENIKAPHHWSTVRRIHWRPVHHYTK